MLVTTSLPRIFKAKIKGQDIELPDPNPTMTPQQVLNFHATLYPELTTAKLTGPEMGDSVTYKFESVMGTKG